MIVDFGIIKDRLGGWIDRNWDHTAILQSDDPDPAVPHIVESNASYGRPVYFMKDPPTAENLARELFVVAAALFNTDHISISSIVIYETPNCSGQYELA